MGASLKSWVCALAVIAMGGCWLASGQDAAPRSAPPSTPNAGGERPAGGGRRTLEGFGELRWLSQQLNLTGEQKEKLRPIVMDEGEQMGMVRLNEHLPLDQKRAKMQEVRDAFRPKIAAILTPEQQEKWKKMQEAAHEKPPDGMKGADSHPAPPPKP